MPYENLENVKAEVRDGILYVTIDRPKVLNALNGQTVEEIYKVFAEGRDDANVKAVILTGGGEKAFVAGADINELAQKTPITGKDTSERGQFILSFIERFPKIVIAAINGFALGGGCELAMACDFRIAAESASFGQPEIDLGIIPGFGGTQRLPRLVGEAKALEMNLIGQPISAAQAYEFGLAHEVVPDHELFDTSLGWARKLAGQAPVAVGQIKKVSAQPDLDAGIEAEKEGFVAAFGSEDAREGIGAFLGKRKPQWKGR
jgi:enoyl-CoA hydratase/carnithine racemase